MAKFILMLMLCYVAQVTTQGISEFAEVEDFVKRTLSDLIDSSNTTYNEVFQIAKEASAYLSTTNGRSKSCSQKLKLVDSLTLASKHAESKALVRKLYGIVFAEVWKSLKNPALQCGGENNFENNIKAALAARKLEDKKALKTRTRRMTDEWLKQIYEPLFALDGGLTLAFVIDTTGSMAGDIKHARDIVKQILSMKRALPASNYILSGFNDPETNPFVPKPFTTRTKNQLALFKKDIADIIASGGGDCKEFAFHGMEAVLSSTAFEWGSPMFVFTDAPPKDPEIKDNVILAAQAFDTKISFFLNELRCHTEADFITIDPKAYDTFYETAKETKGHVFDVPHDRKLGRRRRSTEESARLPFIASSIRATAKIDEATGDATRITILKFPVDDGVEFLAVEIETENNVQNVRLFHNRRQLSSKVLGKVALYDIENPSAGEYFFLIPSGSGKYRYEVNAKLKKPIAFSSRYFLAERGSLKAISHPKKGSKTKTMLSFTGIEDRIIPSSLSATLVAKDGSKKASLTLKRSSDKTSYSTDLSLETSEDLKIKLTGKTLAGKDFSRLSSAVVRAESIVFHLLNAGIDNTVALNQEARLFIIGYTEPGKAQTVTGTMKASIGAITSGTSFSRTTRGRVFIFGTYKAPSDPKYVGKTAVITVNAIVDAKPTVYQFPILIN